MENDPNGPHVLANSRTQMEAQLVVNHLEILGIKALINGAGPSTGWPEALGEIQVVVRRADIERAKQALADMQQT